MSMKRKVLIALGVLYVCLFISACGGNTASTEQSAENNVIVTEETEEQDTETQVTEVKDTEEEIVAQETETQEAETETEVQNTETTASTSETPEIEAGSEAEELPVETVKQGYYPDDRSDHHQAWDNFCEYFNEEDYGTTTKGKGFNELPHVGPTGYDGRLLEERTTDKGYTVMYDTATGRVYYSGMILPIGSGYIDMDSDTVLGQYILDNNLYSVYDITYKEYQELLGVYNGN